MEYVFVIRSVATAYLTTFLVGVAAVMVTLLSVVWPEMMVIGAGVTVAVTIAVDVT
jgi:hypothetical protein